MDYYDRIPELQMKSRIRRIYCLYAGISGLLSVFLVPALISFVYVELFDFAFGIEDGMGNQSFWRDGIREILLWFAISIFVAIFAVCFLRFLYWIRHIMQTHWREHTPPFKRKDQQTKRPIRDPPDEMIIKAEKKMIHWGKLGVKTYFVPILFLILFIRSVEILGVTGEVESAFTGVSIPSGWADDLLEIIGMLPFIGELSVFFERLPGEGILKIIVNGAAIPFILAFRNFAFLLGNIGFVINKAQWWKPNRYLWYVVMSGLGQAFLPIFIMLILTN